MDCPISLHFYHDHDDDDHHHHHYCDDDDHDFGHDDCIYDENDVYADFDGNYDDDDGDDILYHCQIFPILSYLSIIIKYNKI